MSKKIKANASGFTIPEALIAFGLVAALATISIVALSKANVNARQVKLQNDVRVLNSAVATYLGTGGNLDNMDDVGDVIGRLKASLSEDARSQHLSVGGSVIDQRLALRMANQVKYVPRRVAAWNVSAKRFEISGNHEEAGAIAEFYMSDDILVSLPATEGIGKGNGAFNYSSNSGWVWDYTDPVRENPITPTVITPTVINETAPVFTGPQIAVEESLAIIPTIGTNRANNPGFEEFINKSQADFLLTTPEGDAYFIDQSYVNGWMTSASDGLIEVWEGGYRGVDANSGNQFVEFNGTEVSTLYQRVNTQGATAVRISFAHGQRIATTEQLRLYAGPVEPATKTSSDQIEDLAAQGFDFVMETHSSSVGGFTIYELEYEITSPVPALYFAFQSVGVFASQSVGNFLDDVSFRAVAGLEVTDLDVDLTEGDSISNIFVSGAVRLIGARVGDELQIEGSLPLSLSYSLEPESGGEIVLNITGDAFRWEYEQAFSQVKYYTVSENTATRTLLFSVNDGFNESSPEPFEIDLSRQQ